MATSSRWVHTPRGLLILLTTVVALPAATLMFLGVRLLQQDRALAGQRRAEILQDATDRAVRELENELASLRMSLSDPSWPSAAPLAGSIHVLMTRDEIRVNPQSAIAYAPILPRMPEPLVEPFRALETAELNAEDFPKALEISQRLAVSADVSVRAGARLMPQLPCVAVALKRIRAQAADKERLTAREDCGEPSEVTDLAARGPRRSSQRGPAPEPGFAPE